MNLTFPGIFYPTVVVGSVFTFVGTLLLYAAYVVDNIEVVYSGKGCIMSTVFNFSFTPCDEFLEENVGDGCSCEMYFHLPHAFESKVYLYYRLTNYYQNHRTYVNSHDDDQLAGRQIVNKNCWPFQADDVTRLTYAPCGAVANSLFNDTFRLYYITESGSFLHIPILRTNIAWDTDKSKKFKNPQTWEGTEKPPNWKYPVHMLDPSNPGNNGYENEALMVWMKTSAFPNFVKPYGRVDHGAHDMFREGLPGGTYRLVIKYNYPVFSFGGTKSIFLTNLTWMGSKNYFLGVAYTLAGLQFLAVGFLCALVDSNSSDSSSFQSIRRSPFFIR